MIARTKTCLGTAAALAAAAAMAGCEPQLPAAASVLAAVPPPAASADAALAVPPPAPVLAPEPLPALDASPEALLSLYRALDAAERGSDGARVDLVFFGDSHTAGDVMTGRIRSALQARFGDAGRGFVLAGRPPIRHYYQRQIRYGSEGVWRAELGGRRDAVEPFGLGGVRMYGQLPRCQAWVETCTECQSSNRVGRFDVFFLRRSDSGRLAYRIDDGAWRKVATRLDAGGAPLPDILSIPVADGPHRLTLRPGGGGTVELFGVALERERAGVIVDSLGVVGRRIANLHAWDWGVIGLQLKRRDPRLVVLQYGTNEADEPDVDIALLERRYDEVIARIRASVPDAAILVLGPPDMARRPGGSLCPEDPATDWPHPIDVPGASPAAADAGPAGHRTPSGGFAAGVPLDDAGLPVDCTWASPSSLLPIIEAQRRAARRAGVAFFDSLAAMGGADRMDLFFHLDPPLAYSDRVHFTSVGYEQWADLLLAELLAGYDRWKNPGPPARSR